MGRRRRRKRRGRWPLWLALVVAAGAAYRQGCVDDLLAFSKHRRDVIRTSEGPATEYDRRAWQHWVDADKDCQNTRHEVLVAESTTPVTYKSSRRCKVRRGRWVCPYTGQVSTDPAKLDIDHLVPLHNAHRSGADSWNRSRRRNYANSLERPEHLIAVLASANRSKGDQGPEAWLPAKAGYRCAYVEAWVETKERWGLHMNPAERRAIAEDRRLCSQGRVPRRPE